MISVVWQAKRKRQEELEKQKQEEQQRKQQVLFLQTNFQFNNTQSVINNLNLFLKLLT